MPLLPPFLLLLVACAPDETPAPRPTGPAPAWPTVIAEPTAPPGYTWQTVRHETVHARLLLPDGATVTEGNAGPDAPFVRIAHRAVTAVLTFSPNAAWMVPAAGRAEVRETPDNVAWQTERPGGGVRVSAYARGVRCVAELGPFDRGAVDEAFAICGSVRPPPPGAWGPAVARSNGTAVPAGAWVEPSRAEMIGDSLLGPYAPRLYTGWFGLAHTNCPADYATLGAVAEGEAEVAVTRQDSAAGPVYVRRARASRDGVVFDSGARVVAPRGDGCCVAELFPLRAAPSPAEIAYVVALCDTTGG